MTSRRVAERLLKQFEVLDGPIAVAARSDCLAPVFVVCGELAGVPVSEDSQMYVASLTKQLVAALAALAATSGRLDPDARVRHVLPELPAWADPIRIRHLVHHISGLPPKERVLSALGRDGDKELTNEDLIDGVAMLDAPERPPGVAYEYNNLGYVCLAEVVSRVTGTAIDALAQDWIFAPLGMTSSCLGGAPPVTLPDHPAPPRTIGDGGWWTTARDLLRWQEALNEQALGHDVMRVVEAPGRLNDGTPVSYCWGVAVSWRKGVRTFGHGGAVRGWTSKTVRQPERGSAVAVLSSGGNVARISEAALHLADELTVAPREVEPRPLEQSGIDAESRCAH